MENQEKQTRLSQKLERELGSDILGALDNPDIVEIMLNADGALWFDSMKDGMVNTGKQLSAGRAHNLIATVASLREKIINAQNPILETELPLNGSRFAAAIPDVVTSPIFCIRKQAIRVHPIDNYVTEGIMSTAQASAIREAIQQRKSILVVGGPGTGKTTLTNAILNEMVLIGSPTQRFVIIEDTRELQCLAPNTLLLKTTAFANHQQLLRLALRARPDKICMGEARGAEILTLLKAWNTGTPGGVATIHANSAPAALIRIGEMVAESGLHASEQLIAEAVDIIIALRFDTTLGRKVDAVLAVTGFSQGSYQFHTLA